MDVPEHEIENLLNDIGDSPEFHTGSQLIEEYRKLGLKLIEDPSSATIPKAIVNALRNRQPLSAIRIGDGEANLLTYGMYPGTPALDTWVAQRIISAQQDSFQANTTWLLCLQQLFLHSIHQADIVGVRGFWWASSPAPTAQIPRPVFDRDQWRIRMVADPRGTAGILRGTDAMLKLARSHQLNGKTIASAHFYLGIAAHIKPILDAARDVILITSQQDAAKAISQHRKDGSTKVIKAGRFSRRKNGELRNAPSFLERIHRKLPKDLSGTLCLIGAGPWSELYCSLVKQRGGVGVDLGSGFDLLEGRATRPIHRVLGLDEEPRYYLKQSS